MNQNSLESLKRQDKEETCPDCGSSDLDYVEREFICKKCGLLLD